MIIVTKLTITTLTIFLQDDQRMRGGRGGWRGGDRWGDIYAGASVKKMIALYDYDPMELSPNVDMEVSVIVRGNNRSQSRLISGRIEFSNWGHHHGVWGDGR